MERYAVSAHLRFVRPFYEEETLHMIFDTYNGLSIDWICCHPTYHLNQFDICCTFLACFHDWKKESHPPMNLPTLRKIF